MTESRYTARRNSHGQTVIIRKDEEHLPHIFVTWYIAGFGECSYIPVYPGETPIGAISQRLPNAAPFVQRFEFVTWEAA